ncbi:MAG TPA: prephenate dehydrogenase [Gemmatimonadaceae bacterium]
MSSGTRIAIIGLGLMGGSLARAVAARGAHVLGYDADEACTADAMRAGVVHEALTARLDGIESAELVVIALPVDATVKLIERDGGALGSAALVMDVASTKQSIIAAAEAAGLAPRYVGSHPLTGSHRSGWTASRIGLFDDARVFLCPTTRTTDDALRRAESFWRGLRASTEAIAPELHDREMAWRSHLPHLLSATLALTLAGEGVRRSALGPGGRDMTRLAGGSPAMWWPIVADNALEIARALDACEQRLCELRHAVCSGEQAAVAGLLEDARRWFDGDPAVAPID